MELAPAKGKSVETECVMFTFAFAGRSVTWRFTQGVASLALGYGGHWAFSPLGLSGPCGTILFLPRMPLHSAVGLKYI